MRKLYCTREDSSDDYVLQLFQQVENKQGWMLVSHALASKPEFQLSSPSPKSQIPKSQSQDQKDLGWPGTKYDALDPSSQIFFWFVSLTHISSVLNRT